MTEALFKRISTDLGIVQGGREDPRLWHCRIVYSAAVVRGLVSLWEQGDDLEEKSVSVTHFTSVIEQTLTCFRKLFPYLETLLASFEAASDTVLSEQIRTVLQNAGSIYHKPMRVAPVTPACAFEGGISFLRGICPGKTYPMSGAGSYQVGNACKTNQDILSMFGLQPLLTGADLARLEQSLEEKRQRFPEAREFLCLDPRQLRYGYWKGTPDKNVLSLMRRVEGSNSLALYRFDGNTFHCRTLPESWNEHPRYATLAAAMLAQRGLSLFHVKQENNLVYIKPGYLLPPAADAFFRLYTWPDMNKNNGHYFAFRIMEKAVYTVFHDIMTRLGYRFSV